MRLALNTLMVASLIGCAHQSVEVNVTSTTSLEKPSGAPSNPRMGFVGRGSTIEGSVLVQLVRESFQSPFKIGDTVVARNRALGPTAILQVMEIRGMVARARVVRGLPEANDEVVLPSQTLREAAEALPLVKTDT